MSGLGFGGIDMEKNELRTVLEIRGKFDPAGIIRSHIRAVAGGVAGTEATGINNLGQIVGDFFDASGNTHGYLLSMGNFSTIDFPGAFSLTHAEGINSHGEIVGFHDSNDQLHGFKLTAGTSVIYVDRPTVAIVKRWTDPPAPSLPRLP